MPKPTPGSVRRWVDLVRAELRLALSRRATRLLGAVCLAGLLLFSWSQASHVSSLRSQIATFRGEIEILSTAPQEQLFGRSVEEHRESLETAMVFSAFGLHESRRLLVPENSHMVTLGFMGTIPGVGVAVLLASTLFGAEFRWRYWKTALVTEPRRLRVLFAKLVVLWIIVLVALIVLLGISYPANAVFGSIQDVNMPDPPLTDLSMKSQDLFDQFLERRTELEMEPLPKMLASAWLSLSFYSTLAASLVLWVRSSLAGLAGAGIFLLEGLLFRSQFSNAPAFAAKLAWLRAVSPSQQIAFLLPNVGQGQAWYEPLESIIEYAHSGSTGFTPRIVEQFPPIPDWRAYFVLGVWMVLFLVVAAAALRSRDIPA